MKGSLKTVRAGEHLSKANFNDWSDPKIKLLPKREKRISNRESFQQPILQPEPDISDNLLNSVKSETTTEINEIQDKIRKGQPLMSKKDIRNFRLPFYESLLLNLKEDGFFLTYEFIRDLIAIDDAYHKDLETNIGLKNRPILKFTKSVLIPLSEGLALAETSRLNYEKNQEATAFLDLAIFFCNAGDPSWNWIALEMFEQCMEVIKTVDKPVDMQLQATAKYLYGLFLFNELGQLNEAKIQTERSMAISEGKFWTIGDTKEKKRKSLYTESCVLLHKIFLAMAHREMINDNSEEAIQLCRNGLLWAKVMNNKTAEADALRKLLNVYLAVQQLYSVPELLEKYMKLCTELEDFEGLCEGYIMHAKFHDSIGENSSVIEDMKNLLQVAKEHRVTSMIAMAHHKLAIYCLMRGADKELLEHAIEAYMSYLDLKKNVKDTEEARCMVGVAQAREIMTDYCNLVIEAESYSLIEQLVLFRWKNLRIPFSSNKLVFIPEVSANTDLLDKMESKRIDELLAHINRRHSDLISSSSKRQSEAPSSPMFRSMTLSLEKTFSTSSNLSPPRERMSSLRQELSIQNNLSISIKTEETNKDRTVSFNDQVSSLNDRPNVPSASEIMEKQ